MGVVLVQSSRKSRRAGLCAAASCRHGLRSIRPFIKEPQPPAVCTGHGAPAIAVSCSSKGRPAATLLLRAGRVLRAIFPRLPGCCLTTGLAQAVLRALKDRELVRCIVCLS